MILGVDHVGVAVADLDAAAQTFARLQAAAASPIQTVSEQAVRVCFVPAGGAARLELLASAAPPAGDDAAPDDTPLGRFLARRGEGLHHICFAVDDILAEMARLEREGFRLIDRTPRRGHGGQVAFLHPGSAHGVLVELLQRDPA